MADINIGYPARRSPLISIYLDGGIVEQTSEKSAAEVKQEEKQKEAAADEKRLQDAIQADVRIQMDSLIIYAAPPFESEQPLRPSSRSPLVACG